VLCGGLGRQRPNSKLSRAPTSRELETPKVRSVSSSARTHVKGSWRRHSIAPSGRLTGASINAPSGLPLSIRADSHYLYLSSLPFAVLATALAVAVIALRSAMAIRAIRRWRRKSERLIVAALSPQASPLQTRQPKSEISCGLRSLVARYRSLPPTCYFDNCISDLICGN
jgi:hypothetical protein